MTSTVIPFHTNQRYNFTSIMREFVDMGFVWSSDITRETKSLGILGFFIKKGVE